VVFSDRPAGSERWLFTEVKYFHNWKERLPKLTDAQISRHVFIDSSNKR
jgi:hypothetical protein